jgi:hypothetical protein
MTAEKKITYITTEDGKVKVERWEREHFSDRHNQMFTADTVDDLLQGKNLKLVQDIAIPDDSVVCDFCNTRIEEYPVPVIVPGHYALCKGCFKSVQEPVNEKEQDDDDDHS